MQVIKTREWKVNCHTDRTKLAHRRIHHICHTDANQISTQSTKNRQTDANQIPTQSTETDASHKHARMETKLVTQTTAGQIRHTDPQHRHKC